MELISVLCGLGIGAGLAGLAGAVRGTTAPKRPSLLSKWKAERTAQTLGAGTPMLRRAQWAAAAGLFALVWLMTGVFIAAVLAGVGVVGVPWLLSPTKNSATRIGRLDALALWTERLASSLRVGKGLVQAMTESRTGCPKEIAGPVENLADRLEARQRPEEALAAFGDEIGDVTGDRVTAALILASTSAGRGRGLAHSLERYASAVRAEVTRRQQIEADRAKPRTTVRWLTFMTLGVVVAGLFIPSYTAPYGTFLGQLVLGLLSLGFIATLVWMRQLADQRPAPRFMIADPRSTVLVPNSEPEAAQTVPVGSEARG